MTIPLIFPVGDTARARRTDIATSHLAADASNLAASQAEVREILTILGAATDDMILTLNEKRHHEGRAVTRLTPSRGRSARKEIGAVRVEVDGRPLRAPTRTGTAAQVWRLTT